MVVRIREERPGDIGQVREVVTRAFAGAEHSAPPVDETGAPGEASLVEWLRASPAHDPRFALVAVDEDSDGERVVGHVMASWGDLDGEPALGVGPLSVDPPWQRRGVGAALMTDLLARADADGQTVVVLLGDPAYYARFGFQPASELGIVADEAWGDYFQARALNAWDGSASTLRRFRYAEPFARLG